jgi:hypothetical protein
MVGGIILFTIGICTLPMKPTATMVGNMQTGGMSDSEYSHMVVHSASFIEIVVGVILFIVGCLMQIYRIYKEHSAIVPVRRVRFEESV